MKKTYLFFLLFTACAEQNIGIETIEIDLSIANEYYLDDISNDVKVIALESDSVIIGNVTNIKSYDDYNFIFDDLNRTIHAFDTNFKYVNTLYRHGRGPGEYLSFSTFAYDERSNELVIFERERQMLISYSLPNFKYIGQKKYDGYIMSMEFVSESLLFTVKEADFDILGTIELLDISTDSAKMRHSMGIGAISPEISPDQTITREADGSIFYTLPDFINIVYHITDKEFVPVKQISFGGSNMAEKYWDIDYGESLNIGTEMEDKTFAIMPQYSLVGKDNSFSCWFITESSTSQMQLPRTMCYRQDSKGNRQVISSLKLHDIDNIELHSLGLIDGYSVSIISPEEIDVKYSKSKISEEIIELSKNKDCLILVLYKLNK